MQKQSQFKNKQKFETTQRKIYSSPLVTSRYRQSPNPEILTTNKANVVKSYPITSSCRQEKSVRQTKLTSLNQSRIDRFKKTKEQHSLRQSTRSSIMSTYRRAPSNQFKRFLNDSQNVFWQNSQVNRWLRICQFLKICLIMIFLFLAITYFLIRGIQPWPEGQCPQHAECGVFVHCKRGYIRQKNKCLIDPAIKDRAKQICNVVIQQLKIDYGMCDCRESGFEFPTKRTLQIFNEFSVEDIELKNQIYSFLEDIENSVELGYNYKAFVVTPTKKIHPLGCQMQMFTQTNDFYWVVIGVILTILTIGWWIKIFLFKQKAKLAYNYLKHKTLASQFVLIETHKPIIRKLTGHWNEDLWKQIDRLRCQDRRIVFFQQNDQLYWKKFKQN